MFLSHFLLKVNLTLAWMKLKCRFVSQFLCCIYIQSSTEIQCQFVFRIDELGNKIYYQDKTNNNGQGGVNGGGLDIKACKLNHHHYYYDKNSLEKIFAVSKYI